MEENFLERSTKNSKKNKIGSTKVKGNSIATDNIANNCLNYLNNNNYYLNRTSQQKKSPNNNDGRNNE